MLHWESNKSQPFENISVYLNETVETYLVLSCLIFGKLQTKMFNKI